MFESPIPSPVHTQSPIPSTQDPVPATPRHSLEDEVAEPEKINEFAREIANLAKEAQQMEGNPCDWISRFEENVRSRLVTKFSELKEKWTGSKTGVKRTSSGVFKNRTGCLLDDSKGDEFQCDMSPIKSRKSNNNTWLDDAANPPSPSPQEGSFSIRVDSPKKSHDTSNDSLNSPEVQLSLLSTSDLFEPNSPKKPAPNSTPLSLQRECFAGAATSPRAEGEPPKKKPKHATPPLSEPPKKKPKHATPLPGAFAIPAPRPKTQSVRKTPNVELSFGDGFLNDSFGESIDISDYDSDDDGKDSEVMIPGWAKQKQIVKTLKTQRSLDPEKVFGKLLGGDACDLGAIFSGWTPNMEKYERRRTLSGNWSADKLKFSEEQSYKKTMAYETPKGMQLNMHLSPSPT